MKIGLLSDTHGDVIRAVRAAEKLLEHNISALIHCGDVGSVDVYEEMSARCEAHGVPLFVALGNMDSPELITVHDAFGNRPAYYLELNLEGHRIAVHHGHQAFALEAAIASGRFDYVFTGHTHRARVEKVGGTRVINPGAVHRANPPTVAVIDLESGEVSFITLS